MNEAKKAMRKQLEKRLSKLTTDEAALHSGAICERLLTGSFLADVQHLALYAAFGVEVDLLAVAVACATDKTLWYPRFNRERGTYELALIGDPTQDLVAGHWGLLEPGPEAPLIGEMVRVNNLVWLVPGLAFDAAGHRLGRGAGYYDRMLNGTKGRRIAVAHDCQVVPDVPVGPDDETMHDIVTERRAIVCRSANVSIH